MYRRKKVTAAVLAIMMAAAMTACESGSTHTTTADNKNNIVEFNETSITGTVTAIKDNVITVELSSQSGMGGGMAPGGSGEVPDKPSGDGSGSNKEQAPEGNGEVPDKPSGDNEESKSDKSSSDSAKSKSDKSSGDNEESKSDKSSDDSSKDSTTKEQSSESNSTDSKPSESEEKDTTTFKITINDTSILKDAEGNSIELSDIEEGNQITVTFDAQGDITAVEISEAAEMSMGQPGQMGPGSSSASIEYTAVSEYTSDDSISGQKIESTGTDENAVWVSEGATVDITDSTITRDSEDSTGGDNSSFYGVGAAAFVSDGTLNIEDCTITTDAAGGAGVFAYGSGIANVKNTTITTTKNTSGGIHVAGGGTLYAENCTVTTNGESAAAIRSDRGGGTMTVNKGTYTSNGIGSPAVYCTADITVDDADLEATGSEAVCIEGLNTLTLNNCNLAGNMKDQDQNDCTWNVIVYQSMSGDSEVGNGTFSMTGGTLTAKNGGMFYTTNTECTFYLSGVDITYADENDFFLRCTGNNNSRGWGTTGANGSDCSFTADNQQMEGDIIYDSISTLDFTMKNASSLTGAIVDDETYAGNGGDGYCNVTIDSTSKWIVTGDSVLDALVCEGTIQDEDGNTVTIKGTDGTEYVKGTSNYTITVASYSAK